MVYVEKDKCDSIIYNYKISKFRYTISMEKDRYKLNDQRKQKELSCRVAYVSVIYKLYNNVAISNKPPTFRDLNIFIDYSYTRIFI